MAGIVDAFGRKVQFGASYSSDSARLSFAGVSGVRLGVQQLQITYAQQSTDAQEIGSGLTYMLVGPSQGQGTMARLIGPTKLLKGFYAQYGNPCNIHDNSFILEFESGCEPDDPSVPNKTVIALHYVLLNQIGLSMQVQNPLVIENLQFKFYGMSVQ